MGETYFHRSKRTHNFTIIDNTVLRDDRLTWKAKGLFVYLLHLPDDWNIRLTDLVNRSKDGKDSVNSTIKELCNYNYLSREQRRDTNGKFADVVYHINETPTPINTADLPETDFPETVKPETVNPQLLSTNRLRTNSTNDLESLPKGNGAKAHANKSLLPDLANTKSNKSSKKGRDIVTMKKLTSTMFTDENVLAALNEYFDLRLKKGLQPNQWKLILQDLHTYTQSMKPSQILDEINNAIAGGYMQIIPSWKKGNVRGSKPSFDNTGNNTYTRQRKGNYEAATDDNGNPLEF